MTGTNWMDRLSEYLDGTLTPEETAACEAWLSSSEDGRVLLADLRRVVAKAKTLPDLPVPDAVWGGIAAGIREQTLGRSGNVVSMADRAAERPLSVPRARKWEPSPLQLAVAAMILVALGIGFGMKITTVVKQSVAENTPAAASPFTSVSRPSGAQESYDKAVQELRTTLDQNRSSLDPATVQVLEQSLARIDAALVEAERALAQDPNSEYLNDHLSRIQRKKLDLLRQGAALVQAS